MQDNNSKTSASGQAEASAKKETEKPAKSAAKAGEARPRADDLPPPVKATSKPIAGPARMRRRHWGLMLSFFLLVAAPVVALGIYLWSVAEDQYASVTGFIVRQDEGDAQLLGGLAQLTGSSGSADGDILYEYILSQELLRRVDKRADLRAHYSEKWGADPLFSIWPGASIEELEWFWSRIVQVSFDQGSGLMELRVLAFSPEKAQEIAGIILDESQKMINALNTQAREDAMGYAREDLEQAVVRMKRAREALTAFRARTQIVDPEADIQGRMGVMNQLQQQLAEALIAQDILMDTASLDDPRMKQAKRRIEVIRDRIRLEREAFTTGDTDSGGVGENYPDLIAEYEGLVVEREVAVESYRAALAAMDLAQAKASRQSRYLATYIHPTLPEISEYPKRLVILGLVVLFLLLSWSMIALIYYSIRDRS